MSQRGGERGGREAEDVWVRPKDTGVQVRRKDEVVAVRGKARIVPHRAERISRVGRGGASSGAFGRIGESGRGAGASVGGRRREPTIQVGQVGPLGRRNLFGGVAVSSDVAPGRKTVVSWWARRLRRWASGTSFALISWLNDQA